MRGSQAVWCLGTFSYHPYIILHFRCDYESETQFYVLVKTMRSARRIERDIKEAEVKAIDKDRFNKYKESCIKKLELKRKVVADEGVVTYSLCNDVLANLNDLRGYDRVISKKDMDCINEKREELMKISKELNGQKKDNLEDSQKFDVIVSDILNILKKGEYAL